MDAPLATRLEFEVFNRVGDIRDDPVETGLGQYLVKGSAGRADERFAGDILLIAGLFADEDDARVSGPSPKTVWVAALHNGQRLQFFAALRASPIDVASASSPDVSGVRSTGQRLACAVARRGGGIGVFRILAIMAKATSSAPRSGSE
jgi:hypothetical protein